MPKEAVLIVDDQENNRLVIEDMLRKLKLQIRGSSSGEEALTMINEWTPDLILMDQMMPGLSGIETTAQIKANPEFEHVPIVMVTAKNEVHTLKEAFEAGAVDYIIKPVERITLIARVRSALRTKNAFDRITALTEDLQAQKRELTNFTHMVSHDLKSPAASAASLFDFFLYRLKDEHPDIWADESLRDLLQRVPNSLKKMLNFVDTMLTYASAGKVVGDLETVSMMPVLSEVMRTFDHRVEEGAVVFQVEEDMPTVKCDPIKISQVWQNLIGNAIKYRGDKNPVTVQLGWKEEGQLLQFWVQDNGPGIAPEDRDKVFEPFLRLTDDAEGSGIGLATVHQIIKAHQGTIKVDSDYNDGAKFVFTLPTI